MGAPWKKTDDRLAKEAPPEFRPTALEEKQFLITLHSLGTVPEEPLLPRYLLNPLAAAPPR